MVVEAFHTSPRRYLDRPLLTGALALLGGTVVGVLAVQRGPLEALAACTLPVMVWALLRSVWVSYAAVLAVVCWLPFGTLPVGTTVTPTFLELAILTALGLTVAVLLNDRRERLVVGAPLTLWLVLLGVLAFAFLLGLGRGYTTQTLHDFLKFLLGLSVFWLTLQLVRSDADADRVRRLLLVGSMLAALLALALYAAGPTFSERALARLIPYGYPSSRIVRFIEDDPAKPMRAVGTSVDPNSFGGLLMVGCVLAFSAALGRASARWRWLAAMAAAATAAAMLLTFSRGAWVGAAVGVTLVLLAQRPRWLLPLGLAGGTALLAGAGSGFVTRLWLGFTLQDPATKLRLSEFRNAWAIIRRHPWFGVGFGDAPSIDLQTGVSSIYLTIAEQAGLLGLAAFLSAIGVLGWRAAKSAIQQRGTARGELLVGFGAAFAATLTVGLVDHYFFNTSFPHMAALFWTLAGVLVALTQLIAPNWQEPRLGVSSATSPGWRHRPATRTPR